jgi:ADP-ribose pyrophosphatase
MPIHHWNIVSSQTVFERPPYIKLRRDDCEVKPNQISDYYIVERPDYTVVFALTTDGTVPLVRQYRPGPRAVILELPAGYLHPDEDPHAGALRELQEETGYAAEKAHYLGALWESTAGASCRAHCFLALNAYKASELNLDDDETIEVELHPLAHVIQAAARGALTPDGITVAAIFLAAHKLGEQ